MFITNACFVIKRKTNVQIQANCHPFTPFNKTVRNSPSANVNIILDVSYCMFSSTVSHMNVSVLVVWCINHITLVGVRCRVVCTCLESEDENTHTALSVVVLYLFAHRLIQMLWNR